MKTLPLLLLLSTYSLAAAFHGEWGVGVGETGAIDDGAKYLSFDLPSHLGSMFEQSPEAGMWFDRRVGDKSSQYFAYKVGLEPHLRRFYIHYLMGPAFITQTDSLLGSNFQVTHEVGFGVKDERGVRLGFDYRHFSNAGITYPNQGRDFVGFQTEWRF